MNTNILKNIATLRGKNPLFSSILTGIIMSLCLLVVIIPQANADSINASYVAKASNEVVKKAVKTIKVVITAYSSTPDQTDDTPFITASGKHVAEELIANNGLPFGTKVKIPSLYGEKIFVVGDRMNKRMGNHRVDLWMPNKALAINFGVKTTEMQVLED